MMIHGGDDPEHEESLMTVHEFFEEYWHLFFFGMFFLMAQLLPLLFLEDKRWVTGAGIAIAVITVVLLIIPSVRGYKKKNFTP